MIIRHRADGMKFCIHCYQQPNNNPSSYEELFSYHSGFVSFTIIIMKEFQIPFTEKECLFNGFERTSSSKSLFLRSKVGLPDKLPGHPQTMLTPSDLLDFLRADLTTPDLDRFSPWLWLVATQDSAHISSLTHQVVRGREITITENPELHLVWHDKRIFVKPLPPFLLSYDFWSACFGATSWPDKDKGAIYRAAIGFLRSYRYLIRYPSDFALAVDKGLLPVDCNSPSEDEAQKISYPSFITFINTFVPPNVSDAIVSGRYQYGDLRLSRLNFWAKFILGRFAFSKAYGNYDAYFSRFYGPLLFLFGVLSILISSVQLGYTAHEGVSIVQDTWRPLYKIGEGLCVALLVIICFIGLSLFTLLVFMALRETIFALRALRTRRATADHMQA